MVRFTCLRRSTTRRLKLLARRNQFGSSSPCFSSCISTLVCISSSMVSVRLTLLPVRNNSHRPASALGTRFSRSSSSNASSSRFAMVCSFIISSFPLSNPLADGEQFLRLQFRLFRFAHGLLAYRKSGHQVCEPLVQCLTSSHHASPGIHPEPPVVVFVAAALNVGIQARDSL